MVPGLKSGNCTDEIMRKSAPEIEAFYSPFPAHNRTHRRLRMKSALIALTLLSLTACADVTSSYAPDGRRAYELKCSGTMRGWGTCESKAESLCEPAGYDVLRKTGENAAPAGSGAGGVYGSLTDERSMLIACKPQ